jgi:protein TonB
MGADPLPQIFAGVESHSLTRWSGDPESPEIDSIVFHVDRLVNRGRPRNPAQPEPQPAPARDRGVVPFPGGGGAMRAAAARPAERPQPQAQPTAYQPAGDPLAEEAAFWRRIQNSVDPADFYAYLDRYGRAGAFAELAETRLRSLSPRPGGGQQPMGQQPMGQMPGPMPGQMPGPMPQPMPHPLPQHGGPAVQRGGGFNMGGPAPMRPAPQPRLDPHPARSTAPPGAPQGIGRSTRGIVGLIFLAVIAGGGYYVYQQLRGPDPAAISEGDEPWTPPEGSPAEPEFADEGSGSASAPQRSLAAARPAAAAPRPEPEPPPPSILRTLPATTSAPPATTATPTTTVATAPATTPYDPQRDVGPAIVAPPPAPVQIGPQPVAATPLPKAKPRWARRPSDRDLRAAYPPGAQRRNIEGRVVLDCLIGTDLAIRCRAVSESPAGQGFAAAALRVAQQFRAAPTLDDGRPAAGERATVSLVFRSE